ncbi:unnamed protein product [Closterium sp. NIES-65]|nr:unnamed protein product [Closterium sp. NIES-65]
MPPRRVKIKGLPASRPSVLSPLPRSASLTSTSAPVVSAFLGALGRYRRLLLVLLLLALSNIAGESRLICCRPQSPPPSLATPLSPHLPHSLPPSVPTSLTRYRPQSPPPSLATARYRRLLPVLLLLALSNVAGYYYPVLWLPARRATLLATRATVLSQWWGNVSHPSHPSLGKEEGYELRRIISSDEALGEGERVGGRGSGEGGGKGRAEGVGRGSGRGEGGGTRLIRAEDSQHVRDVPVTVYKKGTRIGKKDEAGGEARSGLQRLREGGGGKRGMEGQRGEKLGGLETNKGGGRGGGEEERGGGEGERGVSGSGEGQTGEEGGGRADEAVHVEQWDWQREYLEDVAIRVSQEKLCRGIFPRDVAAEEEDEKSLPISRLAHLSRPSLRSLVFLARHGLGNSLRGFVSAFVFARLSGRHLVTLHAGEHHKVYDLLCHANALASTHPIFGARTGSHFDLFWHRNDTLRSCVYAAFKCSSLWCVHSRAMFALIGQRGPSKKLLTTISAILHQSTPPGQPISSNPSSSSTVVAAASAASNAATTTATAGPSTPPSSVPALPPFLLLPPNKAVAFFDIALHVRTRSLAVEKAVKGDTEGYLKGECEDWDRAAVVRPPYLRTCLLSERCISQQETSTTRLKQALGASIEASPLWQSFS